MRFVAFLPLYIHRPVFFGRPLVDSVRAVCVIVGVLLAMLVMRVLLEQRRRGEPLAPGQASRFVSLALCYLSITYTELIVQGSPLTWRLFLNVGALGAGVYGVRSMRNQQRGKL